MEKVTNLTNNFEINAIGRFIPERSNKDIPLFFFAYWITITNLSKIAIVYLKNND